VFDDQAGLTWVLENQVMLFPSRTPRRAGEIESQDRALLYVTRGSIRGRGDTPSQIVGLVRVTGDVTEGEEVAIEGLPGRTFGLRCPISVELSVPLGKGPAVRDYVDQLDFVKAPKHWGQFFRGSPIEVSPMDFRVLEQAVSRAAEAP
jgi:hypothetical protein